MTYKLDPTLRQYATDRQWELLSALEKHGSERKAAKALGCDTKNFNHAKRAVAAKAARAGYAPEHDYTHPVPDGFLLRGESILYDRDNKPVLKWVKSAVDTERQRELFEEMLAAMGEALPRVPIVKGPEHVKYDFCTMYPVGDHHLGMLSWEKETGGDWDLEIGERTLRAATDHLVETSVPCSLAVPVFIGDFMHYDSFETVTPTSRNQLDSDTRFPKLVRAAVRSMRYLIEACARKHDRVHVIVEIGNHDLASSVFLMECLRNIYENEPRITVDTSPQHFHYFRFGNNLVGTHHGHGVKAQDLPLLMATDRPDDWGATRHRLWLTGHWHSKRRMTSAPGATDYPGATVETLRILAPPDAWAHQKGYRSVSEMQSIMLHREHGEVVRTSVKPAMFDKGE